MSATSVFFSGARLEGSPDRFAPLREAWPQRAATAAPAAGSAYVRSLQRALNLALDPTLDETGVLDAATRNALRRFQSETGLPVDGRVGPATREALLDVSAFAPLEDGEIDQFLGKLTRGISRAAKSVGNFAQQAAKGVGSAATAVSRVVPLSQLAAAASRANPFSTLARAAWGGVAAGLEGKNILGGAVRAAVPTALGRFALDAGKSVLRGENVAQALKKAAQAGISDVREQVRFVQMVAPFVPGVGTGVSAALGAASALAEGRPITAALVAAARGALPGGAAAQAAFDVAANLAQGKSLSAAALEAARKALPGGPLARAAFDTAVALGEGKRLQEAGLAAARNALPDTAKQGFDIGIDVLRGKNPSQAILAAARGRLTGPGLVAFDAAVAVSQGRPLTQVALATAQRAGGGRVDSAGLRAIQAAAANAATKALKTSPYAADALSFARAAARGQNIQTAALSTAGKKVLASVKR